MNTPNKMVVVDGVQYLRGSPAAFKAVAKPPSLKPKVKRLRDNTGKFIALAAVEAQADGW